MSQRVKDDRVRQVVAGASILLTIGVVVPGLLLGWRLMPGLLGEWVGTTIGIMTTPFFMEATFVILGLVIVISLNHWRRGKDGDDFVYLEQVTEKDQSQKLPAHARWAVFREKPLEVRLPTLLEQAEGAFAIGDHAATAHWISEMEPGELKQAETLALRLELAKATDRDDLIEVLENEMRIKTENGS